MMGSLSCGPVTGVLYDRHSRSRSEVIRLVQSVDAVNRCNQAAKYPRGYGDRPSFAKEDRRQGPICGSAKGPTIEPGDAIGRRQQQSREEYPWSAKTSLSQSCEFWATTRPTLAGVYAPELGIYRSSELMPLRIEKDFTLLYRRAPLHMLASPKGGNDPSALPSGPEREGALFSTSAEMVVDTVFVGLVGGRLSVAEPQSVGRDHHRFVDDLKTQISRCDLADLVRPHAL